MRRFPLLIQILVVNSAIVMLGATAGTAITRRLSGPSDLTLIVIFATLGLVLSVAANYALLRVALRPLTELQRTAERVSAGDLSVRAPRPEIADSAFQQLAFAFNTMLDRVERDTLAIERSRQRTERLTQQVINAQEEERRRIASELHDETAQTLATLGIYAETLGQQLRDTPDQLAHVRRLAELAAQALDGVRTIIADLRPAVLDDMGLAAAVRAQALARLEPAGIKVDVQLRGGERRLASIVETSLYRVFQEALTNVLKHAQASYVEIDLDLSDPCCVRARIEDDGQGFTPAIVHPDLQRGRRLGLFGMRERVGMLDGQLEIDSAPGEGTEIRIVIPVDHVKEELRG